MRNQEKWTPPREREFGPEMQPTKAEVATIEFFGFTDASWHNDVCPSFELIRNATPACGDCGATGCSDEVGTVCESCHRGTIQLPENYCNFRLFVDAINPTDRETPNYKRFSLLSVDPDDETESLYEGDELFEVLKITLLHMGTDGMTYVRSWLEQSNAQT